jgi:hypothetical protein
MKEWKANLLIARFSVAYAIENVPHRFLQWLKHNSIWDDEWRKEVEAYEAASGLMAAWRLFWIMAGFLFVNVFCWGLLAGLVGGIVYGLLKGLAWGLAFVGGHCTCP